MKHVFFMALSLGLATSVSAQVKSRRATTLISPNPYSISISPVHFAFSTLEAGIERKMDDQTTLMLRGAFGFRKIAIWEGLGGHYGNYAARLEMRHYFNVRENMPTGAYSALWCGVHKAKFSTTLANKKYELVNSTGMKIGIGIGWKFNFLRRWPGINLDIQVGGGYKLGKVKGRYAEKSRSIIFKDKGIIPAAALQLGFQLGKPAPAEKKNTAHRITPKSADEAIAFHQRYSKTTRKAIEKALRKAGFPPGKANGTFTKKTIQAIRQFQKSKGLEQDGRVGKGTARKLGVPVD